MKNNSEKAKDYFHKVAKSRRVSKNMDRFINKCLNAFHQKEPLKASDLLKDKALFEIRPLKLMAAQVLIETNEIAGDEINNEMADKEMKDDMIFCSTTGSKKEWTWKEVMDLILDLETKKHMKQEEDRLRRDQRKIEKRENDKRNADINTLNRKAPLRGLSFSSSMIFGYPYDQFKPTFWHGF